MECGRSLETARCVGIPSCTIFRLSDVRNVVVRNTNSHVSSKFSSDSTSRSQTVVRRYKRLYEGEGEKNEEIQMFCICQGVSWVDVEWAILSMCVISETSAY